MRRIFVFDMDGTLIDSYRATQAAYRQAAKELGVTLPVNFWGQPAAQWHCSSALHTRKTKLYSTMVCTVPVGWAWKILLAAESQGAPFHIWTGASIATVTALCCVPMYARLGVVKCSMTVCDKRVELLRLLHLNSGFEIHYFDDSLSDTVKICHGLPHVVCHVRESGVLCE